MHKRVLTTICIILSFFANHAIAQSDQLLVDRYDQMYAAQKYELALKAAELICDRYPTSATWHFNAGALCAKLDQHDNAIQHLQICADNKFSGIASFELNTDLDSIRDREDFKEILKTVGEAAKTRMDEFQQEADKHTPKSYYPPESTTKPILIIALHGTGMDGISMFDAIEETARNHDAILICPDALRPSGNGFSWTYRDESEWFVNSLIDDAIQNHNADADRVILIGYSQGANIALIMGQTQPDRFLAVVPICGHYEPQNASSKTSPAPFYLISGARDPWRTTYLVAKNDFEEAGGDVQIRMLSGYGHQLPSGATGTREYTKAIKWALEHKDD